MEFLFPELIPADIERTIHEVMSVHLWKRDIQPCSKASPPEPFPVKSTPILLLLLIFRGILYGGESVIGKGNGMTQQEMK